MGSGTNRAWLRTFGSRTARRSNTKTRNPKARDIRLKAKSRKAEAARRSNP